MLLFTCRLHRGNISSLPCSTKERQSVSLDLKPRSLSDEERRFSSLPCILMFSSLRCLKMSAKYASFTHHCSSASSSAYADFSSVKKTLSSSLNSYNRPKPSPVTASGLPCVATSSDALPPFPRTESKTGGSLTGGPL